MTRSDRADTLGDPPANVAPTARSMPLHRWQSRLSHRTVTVAILSFAFTIGRLGLKTVPLPFDPEYEAVLWLMWPRPGLGWHAVGLALMSLDIVCILVPLLLLAIVVLRPAALKNPTPLIDGLARHAVLLPLLAFVAATLSRIVSNGVYAAAAGRTADLTAHIARLEAPLIEAMQGALASDWLDYACAVVYAGGWFLSLLAAVPLLALAGRHGAALHLLVGWILIPLLAAPLFLLFPVFEPWAVNPQYGYEGPAASNVRFLGANSVSELRHIALDLRWATGACIPSLHVAIPALAMSVCYTHGLRGLGSYYGVLTAVVGFVVVHLGRHWIVDVIAGVGFAIAISSFLARVGRQMTLPNVFAGRRVS